MCNKTVENFLNEQNCKLTKLRNFYNEKINEGTCFAKSITHEIEQQMKCRMSVDEILNYWFKQ